MRRGKIIASLGLICLLIAAGFVVYNIWDDYRAGKEASVVVEQLNAQLPTEVSANPAYKLAPYMDMPVQVIDGNAYVGQLQMPSLGIDLPVMEEWSYPNLLIAPCRYSGTPYLKNFVIAAHNYQSHFGRLKELKPEDEIIFTDMAGNVFMYQVVDFELLGPVDTEEMEQSDYALTLFTCTLDGGQRVTVRCDEITNESSNDALSKGQVSTGAVS